MRQGRGGTVPPLSCSPRWVSPRAGHSDQSSPWKQARPGARCSDSRRYFYPPTGKPDREPGFLLFVHPVAVGCCLVRPSLQGPVFPDLAEFGHHHRSVTTPDLGAAQNTGSHLPGIPLLGWMLRGVSHALVGRGPFSQGNPGRGEFGWGRRVQGGSFQK